MKKKQLTSISKSRYLRTIAYVLTIFNFRQRQNTRVMALFACLPENFGTFKHIGQLQIFCADFAPSHFEIAMHLAIYCNIFE